MGGLHASLPDRGSRGSPGLPKRADEAIHLDEDYEARVIRIVANYLAVAASLGVQAPVYVFLSFVDVRGCVLDLHPSRVPLKRRRCPLSENIALLPEVVLNEMKAEPARALRPVFNMVWNAFGLPGSPNYDEHGNWKGGRR